MDCELAERGACALELALVILGLVPGNGLERGLGQFGFLNLVGGRDLFGELGLGPESRIRQDLDGSDWKTKPDGQEILFLPQIRPLALAVIDDDVAVLGHGCLLLLLIKTESPLRGTFSSGLITKPMPAIFNKKKYE